ncbi:MAG TPA: hypothetical protein VFY46_04600 [Acidimicrobiia bacterium]|nr:hypothetical protein [Acidimicrobiia bacterium]
MGSRRLIGTSLALVIVLLPVLPATAKGPGSATITGPGGTVDVSPGNFRYVDEDPYWDFQNESGVISLAVMPGAQVGTKPAGELGEPLVVIWNMGDRDILQFLYMNAEEGPVTYVEPDPGNGIRGGWHRPLPGLRTALEELGVEIPAPDPGTIIKGLLIALTAGVVWKI